MIYLICGGDMIVWAALFSEGGPDIRSLKVGHVSIESYDEVRPHAKRPVPDEYAYHTR
jgi:hypothetical protein